MPTDDYDLTIRSDVTVEIVKHTASDHDVLFAARVSTVGEQADRDAMRGDCTHQGLECQWSQCSLSDKDKGLINYLMRDRHGSPFEHNSMTFFVSAPIFVFREFMRHRVGFSYNEESGRYRELQPVFYVPGEDRKLVQKGRPGKYEMVEGTPEQHRLAVDTMARAYVEAYEAYQLLLADGVAREVARSVLPVGLFSSMYVTCNARSLMHFLGLRTTSKLAKTPSFPQREIEMVAEQMEAKWGELMPLTYEAFNKNGRVAP
ncbi:FAD-dependent thymidylate synthase (plasmid) [Streptomyces sp. RLB1-9]|uniref:FAD-dependent thymidylate synthase n=1 Tax=Streptomyces sp. RLB1-9 TaxID=2594454 RepID=UPI001162C30E|nr:FAD-dependent thymidylate synthase [Streptomyces sp. RLB1-9]QDN95021.1 FAD-dependent thymidylate synthase [Streptomyces sp. RLB1-9]